MGHLSEDSPEILAARYAGWDTAELARALELESDGYRPEALELMRRELDRRGVDTDLRTMAREAEVENDRRLYVRVGGWLGLFVVGTAVFSLWTVSSVAEALHLPLAFMSRYLLVSEGLVGLYGLVVIALILLRYRDAPRHAKIFLGISWLTSAVAVLLWVAGIAFAWLVLKSIGVAIWWSYFSVSKRVRMTFRPESEWYDEGPTPPPPRAPSSPAPSSPPAAGP